MLRPLGKRVAVPPENEIRKIISHFRTNYPAEEQCHNYVTAHVMGARRVAEHLIEQLARKGITVNRKLVLATIDLHDSAKHVEGVDHEEAVAEKLRNKYPLLAEMITRDPSLAAEDLSLEHRLFMYADWRSSGYIVSLERRRRSLLTRYADVARINSSYRRMREFERELKALGVDTRVGNPLRETMQMLRVRKQTITPRLPPQKRKYGP